MDHPDPVEVAAHWIGCLAYAVAMLIVLPCLIVATPLVMAVDYFAPKR